MPWLHNVSEPAMTDHLSILIIGRAIIYDSSIFDVVDAVVCDGELGLALGDHRRVDNFQDAVLASSFAQVKPGGGRVRDDVAADCFRGDTAEEGCSVDLRHHLICDDDGDSELVSETLKLPQELGQVHLPSGELTAARVVCAVQRCR